MNRADICTRIRHVRRMLHVENLIPGFGVFRRPVGVSNDHIRRRPKVNLNFEKYENQHAFGVEFPASRVGVRRVVPVENLTCAGTLRVDPNVATGAGICDAQRGVSVSLLLRHVGDAGPVEPGGVVQGEVLSGAVTTRVVVVDAEVGRWAGQVERGGEVGNH